MSIPTASRRSAFSCRRGSTARRARPIAISSIGCCIRISGAISRAASFARGARRRLANPANTASRTSPATVTRASAKAAAPRTSSPAPAWTKPGPPARNLPRPSSNCSRPKSRSRKKTSTKPTSNAAARAGWKPKAASPKNPATVFKKAWPPA